MHRHAFEADERSNAPGRRIDARLMRKIPLISLISLFLLAACSPRDFLSRRLAADLIAASDTFRMPQQYVLQTGVVSNKDYLAPEFLILEHHGWISVATARCPAGMVPPPCWDVLLTPSGADTVRAIVPAEDADKPTFTIPVARRELIDVTGIFKQGDAADVEFTWRWVPLNEIGAALYSSDLHSKSTVAFRQFDTGWRVMQGPLHSGQSLDDALKNAEPTP
jgi:hypothetical protein